jgi:GT2 family glycosyltransferase
VNYNSAAFIGEFCDTLEALDYPNWRLVCVDSASSDGSADEIARRFPSARMIRCQENVGFAAGANLGVEECLRDGDHYVLFLNNDTTLTPQFLSRMVMAADERRIVVPKILYYDDHALVSTHAGGFDWTLGVFRDTFHRKTDGPATNRRRDDIETASFACALVPAEAFRDAGLLDERFFMYYEETDWLRRARAFGYRLRYDPSAVIYHRESGSSGGGWMNPFKMYYATRNRPYLVRKQRPSLTAYAWFTAYFWATRAASTARLLLARQPRLARAMWLGVFDYYRGRMGRTRQVGDL